MGIKPDHPTQRPCACGGANPNCLQCGGSGLVETPGFRPIMAGPAGTRRRPYVAREIVESTPGIPEPRRCPHCGLDVLNLAVHLTEAHPEMPQQETDAEREAREQEEARLAAVAAELARREAEAAQRKAEARARRQAIEGPQSVAARPDRAWGIPSTKPPRQPGVPGRPAEAAVQAEPATPAGAPAGGPPDRGRRPGSGRDETPGAQEESRRAAPTDEVWERMRRARGDRTVLTGVVRSRKPFGVFVDLGGIEGLVRWSEMRAEETGRERPGLQVGQSVKVVVIEASDETHRVTLSMRRAEEPQTVPPERVTRGQAVRAAEGPMALAFRLAREKKQLAD
jgi:predicted RNA-binding protein with RPS1 domain